MSKNKVTLETHSVQDTQCFGERLGQWVKESASPLCMALTGDLACRRILQVLHFLL